MNAGIVFGYHGAGACRMAQIDVALFQYSDATTEKFWYHGIRTEQMDAVLGNFWIVIHNRKGRAAPYVLIGRDDQGHCLAIPIAPTDDPVVWRPITAWYCKPSEVARLRRGKSIMDEPIPYGASQEPLDDEERELMDPDFWDWDAMEVGTPVRVESTIFSMQFSRDEHHVLANVAYGQGITPHEFIKRVALAAARAGVKVDALEFPQAAITR
jgi:hypothetical protein